MDEKIKKDIINCSRCGLCMEVCPVYRAKKTETSVSRGKFLQLLGLIRHELQFDKKVKYNLDLCLNCGKCKKNCPSDIDAVKIFSEIKNEYQTPFEKFLNSAFVFKIKMFCLKLLYKIKYPIKRSYYKKKPHIKKEKNIAHFNGCATRAINGRFEFPNKFVEEKFSCCALPFYVKGNFKVYEKYKKRNLELIEKYDKVVFDCASCYDTVLNYDGVDKNKLIYFTDFYKNKNLKALKETKATFHKPCHLNNKTSNDIEEILKNIENLQYEKMEKFDNCCGFGGDFFTRHINTSTKLAIKKIESARNTGADVILTSCPTCLWALKYAIKLTGAKLKAYDIADFLHNFVDIKP